MIDIMKRTLCLTFRCGKTTVCQLYAEIMKKSLHAVNCHLHTESADFLGGLRPVRHKQEVGPPKRASNDKILK